MALSKVLSTAAGLIAKPAIKKLKKSLSENHAVVKVLNDVGIDMLSNTFDSLYIHAYIKFCINQDSGFLRSFFIEPFIVEQVRAYISNPINSSFLKAVRCHDTYIEYNSENKDDEIITALEEIHTQYKFYLSKVSTPLEMRQYDFMIQLTKDSIEKSFDYQIEKKLEIDYAKFHNKFIKDNKYIDLNARTMKPKKNLVDLKPDAKDEEKYDIVNYDPVYKYINNWLNNNSSNFLIIMGEYGTGKTTLCDYIKYNLTCKLLDKKCDLKVEDNNNRIPMIFPLRKFREEDIEDYINAQLVGKRLKSLDYDQFADKAAKDEFTVVFDGFDEMAIRNSTESKRINFSKILKIVEDCKKSKFILTTREEYFRTDEELRKVFDKYKENILHLKLFNDEQINQFLVTHGINPKEAEKLKEKLSDTMERPVLLDLVCKYFKKIKNKLKSGDFKVSDLYKEAIDAECRRVAKKNRYLETDSFDRRSLLEQVAVELYINEDRLSMDVKEISEHMKNNENYKSKTQGQIENDLDKFLCFDFMTREKDNHFRISHKSFRDYLVAVSFTKEIESGNIVNFGKAQISKEIAKFISEQIKDIDKLKQTATEGKIDSPEEYYWQAGNAVMILQLLGDEYFNGLDLRNCNLKNIVVRDEILETNFEGADFSNSTFSGRFYKLDDRISALTNLSGLDLAFNFDLELLSETIGDLQKLEKLDLSVNRIGTLPEIIGKLINLKALEVSHNELTELPDSIGNLANLKELLLDNNQLTKLPESIGNLVNLQELLLYNSQLTELPESFGKLVNLQLLRLDNNQLTELPESIGGLLNLELLDLMGNKLEELPKTIIKLKKLRVLDIKINPIPKSHIDWLKENMPNTAILSDYN